MHVPKPHLPHPALPGLRGRDDVLLWPAIAEVHRQRGLRRRGRRCVSVCLLHGCRVHALLARHRPALRKDCLHLAGLAAMAHLTFVKKDGTPAAFNADAGFLLDPLSAIWLLFVTGVGMLIHIYSVGYMAHEGGYYRFFGYLNLFMFSMLTLILANNYMLHVRRMGRRRPVLVSADRLLFPSQVGERRRQQSVHREPHWRRRIHSGRAHAGVVSRFVPLHRHQCAGCAADTFQSAIPS